jgi:hypothetical protein
MAASLWLPPPPANVTASQHRRLIVHSDSLHHAAVSWTFHPAHSMTFLPPSEVLLLAGDVPTLAQHGCTVGFA